MAWGVINLDQAPARPILPVWPVGRQAQLMPLGDSITRGMGGDMQGGYRNKLMDDLRAAGRSVKFVGGMSGVGRERYQAEASWKIQDHTGWGSVNKLSVNAIDHIRMSPPDIIVAHLGTNNMQYGTGGIPNYMRNYRELLDLIYHYAPDCHVFIARIVLQQSRWSGTIAYNDAQQLMTEQYIAEGRPYHVITGCQDLPDGSWNDAIHPNNQGYDFMTNVIGAALLAHP